MKFLVVAVAMIAAHGAQADISTRIDAQTTVTTPLAEDGFFIWTFDDGSGSVSTSNNFLAPRWRFECKTDAMTDENFCSITYSQGDIFIALDGTGVPTAVCALHHRHHDKRAMMRVDKQPPLTMGEDGCVPASQAMAALVYGQQLVVRSYDWPSDVPKETYHPLFGLKKTIEVVVRNQSARMRDPG